MQWSKDKGFVKYDFNSPENITTVITLVYSKHFFNQILYIPADLSHSFDIVIVDPPFITQDVWEKYATTVKLILKKGILIL